MALFADRIRLIDTENAFAVGPCIREAEADGHRVIRCNIGEPDFELPAHIRDEVKRQLDAGNTHYSDPQGILSLREPSHTSSPTPAASKCLLIGWWSFPVPRRL